MEEKEISKAFRSMLLIHFIVCYIFGWVFLIAFDQYTNLIGWPYFDPITGRLLGATFVGIGSVSLYLYKYPKWSKVEVAVVLNLPWILISIIVNISGQIIYNLPLIHWMHTAILIIFFIAYLYFFITERKWKMGDKEKC